MFSYNYYKTIFVFLVFLHLANPINAQSKYKRTYTLKENYFEHVAAYASGNAVIFVDRDSLLENLQYIIEYSDYYDPTKEKLKYLIDTITILSKKSDITYVSSIAPDNEIAGILLSYFSKCIMNKTANIYDKRTNTYVKKIIIKKSAHSSRSYSSYSWYYYFLPNDKREFMHRVERAGTGIKFL